MTPNFNDQSGYAQWVFGDNSGNDMWWGDLGPNITFDPAKLYRIRFEDVYREAGTGVCYLGWMGYAADGTTKVNVHGGVSYSSQHYHAALGDAPSSVTTYTGYTQGHGSPNGSVSVGTLGTPVVVHEDVAFIRPLLLVNYNTATGIFRLGKIVIDEVDGSDNVIANIATYTPGDTLTFTKASGGLDTADITVTAANDATPVNFPDPIPTTAGPLGEDVVVFDGADGYLNGLGPQTDDMSFGGWYHFPSAPTYIAQLGGADDSGTQLLTWSDGSIRIHTYPEDGSPSTNTTNGGAITAGWHHLVVTVTGGNTSSPVVALYIDGALAASKSDINEAIKAASATEINLRDASISVFDGAAGYHFRTAGVLTAGEVSALQAAATPAAHKALAISYGAVAYWSMAVVAAATSLRGRPNPSGLRGRRNLKQLGR